MTTATTMNTNFNFLQAKDLTIQQTTINFIQ